VVSRGHCKYSATNALTGSHTWPQSGPLSRASVYSTLRYDFQTINFWTSNWPIFFKYMHALTQTNTHTHTESVRIATGQGLKSTGSIPEGQESFCYSTASRPALGPTQPPIKWAPRGSFLGGKAAGEWSWPFTSISSRVQKWWSYTSTSPNVIVTLYSRETRQVLTRIAKCIDVDGGIFENVLH
jgi:hypothetical protein